MKELTLQYTLDAKSWTDLRQNGQIEIDEQAYLLNAIRTPTKFFKDIYLGQYLTQKIIKDALPKDKKPILAKKIPFSCRPFAESNVSTPDEGQVLLKIQLWDTDVVTVDYEAWLHIANSVNKALQKYDSTKAMNKILSLPEKELALDSSTRVYLLDVLDQQKTMNLIPKLDIKQVVSAYENENGQLSEIQNY